MTWSRVKLICGHIDNVLDIFWTITLTTGGAILALTVVLQVCLRYVFKAPLFGLEELSRFFGVWLYFIGAIIGTRLDSHVQGDVAERFFKSFRSKAALKTVTSILGVILCILFAYHSGKYSFWIYETGEKTTGLWWPRITSVGSMFFGAIFMTLYSISNTIKYLEQSITGRPSDDGGTL
jgi:TRAP-type transport system small permease protein